MSGRTHPVVRRAADLVVDGLAAAAPVLAMPVLFLAPLVLATIALAAAEGHVLDGNLVGMAVAACLVIPLGLWAVVHPIWNALQDPSRRIRRRLRMPGFAWGKELRPPGAVRPPPAPLEDRMAVLHRRWPRQELAEQWTGESVSFELARATWSLRGWLAGRHRLPVRISAHALVVGRQAFAAGEIRRVRLEGQRIVVHRVGERAWKSPRLLFADRRRVAELLARLDHSDAEIQELSRAARSVRAALEPLRHLQK